MLFINTIQQTNNFDEMLTSIVPTSGAGLQLDTFFLDNRAQKCDKNRHTISYFFIINGRQIKYPWSLLRVITHVHSPSLRMSFKKQLNNKKIQWDFPTCWRISKNQLEHVASYTRYNFQQDVQSDNLKKTLMYLCVTSLVYVLTFSWCRVCVCVCVRAVKNGCAPVNAQPFDPGDREERNGARPPHTRWWLVITDKREIHPSARHFQEHTHTHTHNIFFFFFFSRESIKKNTQTLSPIFRMRSNIFHERKRRSVCGRGLGKWAERNSWLF